MKVNRVSAAIVRMRVQIADRIKRGITTEDKVAATGIALDMEPGEFVRFQELKTLASQDGTLTLEEAQYVFRLLGNTPEHFNSQDVATKAVLTQLLRDLLERTISHA